MKNKLNIIPIALVAVAFGVIAWAMAHYEANYLWKVQELNLFLDTELFFKQQMVVPGGMLTYLGTFFTDFFYHTWLGVVVQCVWWALLLIVSALTFKVPLKWLTVLLIPVALLLLSNMELGYWIYYLKLRGYNRSDGRRSQCVGIPLPAYCDSSCLYCSLCRYSISTDGILWLVCCRAHGNNDLATKADFCQDAYSQYHSGIAGN